jgi:hypothetical protein
MLAAVLRCRSWSDCWLAGWRKPALDQVARWVDGKQHLQERLSAAWKSPRHPGLEGGAICWSRMPQDTRDWIRGD